LSYQEISSNPEKRKEIETIGAKAAIGSLGDVNKTIIVMGP